MLRKVLFLCTALLLLPLIANAWTLSTRVMTVGGTLQVGTNPPQTVANGTVTKSYAADVPVTLTQSSGYQISEVKINGISQPLPLASNTFNMGLVAYPGKTSQGVTVSFAQQLVSVTASSGAGGTVSPIGTSSKVVGTNASYTFTPTAGRNLVAVTGAPPGTTYTDVSVTPNVAATLPAPANHVIRMGFTVPNSNVAFSGMFAGIIADAGPPRTVLPGQTATLTGSAAVYDGSPSVSYAWTQTGGPAGGTLTNANLATAGFSSATNGVYTLKLVATTSNGASSTATTSVTVTDSAATASRSQCANCHNSAGVGSDIFTAWSTSRHKTSFVICAYCHIGADTGAHPGTLNSSTVDSATFTITRSGGGGAVGSNFCAQCHSDASQIVTDHASSPHKQKPNGPSTCSGCHGNAHAVTATADPCKTCHADTGGNVSGHPVTIGTTACTVCHNPHSTVPSACDGCHDCPPPTATHLKHYGGTVAQAGYGNTTAAKDFGSSATGYIMNCGTCHPMDPASHMNGTVDIELYNSQAPAGSLKALNPPTAAYVRGGTVFEGTRGFSYTMGTCSNIYCHSYADWTTGVVPLASDCLAQASYWPDNLEITRVYKPVTWGGPHLTCSGCHANPPRTSYPANDGGAGNSHSWIDSYGYESFHSYNMGFDPISCKYCHADTVQQLNTFTHDSNWVATLGDVPIANYSKHVNGINDVSFDKQNPFVYQTYGGSTNMSLSNATYDASTKTCMNVSCHLNQTSVKWGTPYRWDDYAYECDRCHHYGACN